jgi:hypothetical protein
MPLEASRVPILSLTPALLGFILLALHFFRSDNLLAMGLSLLLIVVLFIRRPWVSRILQVFLLLGSVEWVRTAIILVLARKEAGEPFLRLGVILGGVAVFTALASLVFQTDRVKAYFRQNAGSSPE